MMEALFFTGGLLWVVAFLIAVCFVGKVWDCVAVVAFALGTGAFIAAIWLPVINSQC